MHIGKALKAYVENGWRNKSEFCRKVEVSPQLLNAYFKSADVRHSTLRNLAEKLGLDFEEFMRGLSNANLENVPNGNP